MPPRLGEESERSSRSNRATLTEDEVREWVRASSLTSVPARRVAHTLPRNASGKLLKNVLRGEGEVGFAETL